MVASKKIQTFQQKDLAWGINSLKPSNDIDDKQFVRSDNFTTEGNKLIKIKWYKKVKQFSATISPSQWIKLYGNVLVYLHNAILYVYNTNTYVTKSLAAAVTVGKEYHIEVFQDKIVCCNKDEAPKAFTYDTTFTNNPTTQAFTWLNAGFTATASNFNKGTLLLAQYKYGSPSQVEFSNVLVFSQSVSSYANLANAFLFTGGDASTQVIGDWNPITWFISGRDATYITKNSSIFKLDDKKIEKDSAGAIVGVAYPHTQVTSTWAVNHKTSINVDQDIFYFDWLNVRRLSYEANVLALKDSAISIDIYNTIQSLPRNQSEAVMWYTYPYVKLALKSAFAGTNDIIFCYNVIDKSWNIQKGIVTNVATYGHDITTSSVDGYFGSYFNGTVYEDDRTSWYDWGNIKCIAESKHFDFWNTIEYKRLVRFSFHWDISENFPVTIKIFSDDGVNIKEVGSKTIQFTSNAIEETTGSVTSGTATAGGSWANWLKSNSYREKIELFSDWREFYYTIECDWIWEFSMGATVFDFRYVVAYPIH